MGQDSGWRRNYFSWVGNNRNLIKSEKEKKARQVSYITVHTYQKEILDDLFSNTAREFLTDLDYLLKQLEKDAPTYASNGK